MKKKLIALLLAALLCAGLAACGEKTAQTPAQDAGTTVFVTVASAGELVAAQEPVTVTDADADGALTVNDALICAHDALFDGGAAAGYAAADGGYGLAVTKLWGVENGGSYGYDLNNAGCMNVEEAVADGDHLNAYSYADLAAWSDVYAYFDAYTAAVKAGDALSLRLCFAGFDADFNTVETPAAGAVITVDGAATEFVTDADGAVTLSFDKAGVYVISAVSETDTLVPPVCVVTVA